MEEQFAQPPLGAQSNQYHTVNIYGNARAILGNVASDPDLYRPGSNVDWKNTLRALYYDGMRTRKTQIDARASSPEYVEWVWRTNFAAWLKSEESFFWITGYPGSGKSTLMKHIADSKKTKQHLQQGGEDWAIVHFFFDFRAGGAVSNSLEGMLRTLLYQVLKRCPELARNIDPPLEEDFSSLSVHSCLDCVCEPAEAASFKVCAFIDGLDEFEGSGADLVDVIRSLEDRAGFKLCLASRPYQIFQSNFSRYLNLVVQDFNRESMEMYARAQWESKRLGVQPGLPKSLSDKVIERARGSFLWLRLAVDVLIQDLVRGKAISVLEVQLEEMPKGVEAMYQRVLDRIPGTMRWEAAILLNLIMCSNSLPVSITNLYMVLEAHIRRCVGENSVHILPIDLDDEEGLSARILNSLGDFIDIVPANVNLPFTRLPVFEDEHAFPFIAIRKDELFIRRGQTACVALIHETLKTFLCGNIWFESHTPMEFRSEYPRNLWLNTYLKEIETFTVCQPSTLHEDHLFIRQYVEKTRSLFFGEEEDAIDSMGKVLLTTLQHWSKWTPLLLLAVQNLPLEVAWSRPIDQEVASNVNVMLNAHVMRYHVPICIFKSCNAAAMRLRNWPGKRDLPVMDAIYDYCCFPLPTGTPNDMESVRWDSFFAISHDVPELTLYNEQLLTRQNSGDEVQKVFDYMWRRIMVMHRADQESNNYRLLLAHFLAHGGQMKGPHLCDFLRIWADGYLMPLDVLSHVSKDTGLYHAQDCKWSGRGSEGSTFWCHWVKATPRGGITDLESVLEVLVGCGQQVNAPVDNQPLLNAVIESDEHPERPCLYPSRMKKTIVALRAGADPQLVGKSGNALQAAKKQLATLEVLCNLQKERHLEGLTRDPDAGAVLTLSLKDVMLETVKIKEMLEQFVEQKGLSQHQYEKYEKFNCLHGKVLPIYAGR